MNIIIQVARNDKDRKDGNGKRERVRAFERE